MKNVVSILLIVLLFSLSGCSNAKNNSYEENRNNSNKSPKESSISIDVLEPFELKSISYEIKLEELKNIVDYDFSRKLFITNDGSLYKIGEFSDGTNLKKISEGFNLLKFRKQKIVSNNNLLYSYNDSDFSIEAYHTDGKDYINHSFVSFGSNTNLYKATLKNNEIYLVYHRGEDIPPEFKIHNFAEDETIELFINGTIKTNKGYYYFKKTVNESEYDDVPDTTTYSLEKITVLDDDIVFVKCYNNNICIVDKSGHLKIFSNVNY